MTTEPPTSTVIPRPVIGSARLLEKGPLRINYFVRGAGETVVLWPAFCRSASDFNELVEVLNAAGYRTVAIQPRGVGESQGPVFPHATLHDFATDVADVVRALDNVVGGRVHVLGRALGARVARMVATKYPELTQSVILLVGGGRIAIRKSGLLRYVLCNLPLVPRWLHRRAVERTLYAPGNPAPPHLAYRHTVRAFRRQFRAVRTPAAEIWSGGDAPALCVHGEQDRLVPVSVARALQAQHPDQVQLVVIPNAGHSLIAEQPDAVFGAVESFLRAHPITSGTGG